VRSGIALAIVALAGALGACEFSGNPIDRDAPVPIPDGPIPDGPIPDGPISDGPISDGPIPDARPDASAPDAAPDAPVPDAAVPDAPLPDARPDASVPDAAPDAAPICPGGYTFSAATGSAYRVIDTGRTWAQAEADCEDDGFGVHLVVVNDAPENAIVDGFLTGPLWVGVTDRITEDSFLAVTGGTAPYLDWNTLQPDNFFDEDCVTVTENGRNTDIDCGSSRNYVCECDGIPADPSTF
jgi:hypothetical protein